MTRGLLIWPPVTCMNCEGYGCPWCLPPACGCSPERVDAGECPHEDDVELAA